jgi:hypothetical protein
MRQGGQVKACWVEVANGGLRQGGRGKVRFVMVGLIGSGLIRRGGRGTVRLGRVRRVGVRRSRHG